ncbi:MAG: hypothetical protein ISS23_03055 [Nanoarchaeota archaeon]|nr:hypothetical protein [Nanoarchaeota archaeon]
MNESFTLFLVLLLIAISISGCGSTEEGPKKIADVENCGKADFSVIELKAMFEEITLAPEAKAIYDCMNKHVKDCSKAYFSSTGDANIKFSIDGKENDKCLLSMDYGEVKREDQKKYANTYLNCKIGADIIEKALEKKDMAYPQLLVLMALLSTQKDDTICTGTMKGIGTVKGIGEVSQPAKTESVRQADESIKVTEPEEETPAPAEEKFIPHEILPISEVISNSGSCYGRKNCLDNLNSDNGNYIQWVACASKYSYDTPTTFTFDVDDNDKVTSAKLNIDLTRSGEDAYATVRCLNLLDWEESLATIKTRFKPEKGKEYSWDVPVACFKNSEVNIQISRTGSNCWGVDYVNLEVYRRQEKREVEKVVEKEEEPIEKEEKEPVGTTEEESSLDLSIKTTSTNSDIGCLMIKGILGGEPHKETSIGSYDIKATDNEIEVRKGSSLIDTMPIQGTNSVKDGSNTLWFVNDDNVVYIALNPIENTVKLNTRFSGTRSGENVEYEITKIDTGWKEVRFESDRHGKSLKQGKADVFGDCTYTDGKLTGDGAFFYVKDIVSEEEAKLLILMK